MTEYGPNSASHNLGTQGPDAWITRMTVGNGGWGLVVTHDPSAHIDVWSGRGEAEEHGDGPAESRHVVVGETADTLAEFGSWDGGDLVDHESARPADPGLVIRIDRNPEQRSVGRVGCERANRDGGGRVEKVVLDDHDWARLADVATAGSSSPDFTSLHAPSPRASMNA